MFRAPDKCEPLGETHFFAPFIQRVRRCSLCQRFGHSSSICRSDKLSPICAKCASKGHSEEKCPSATLSCINCKRHRLDNIKHAAFDAKCPIFVENRKVKVIIAKLGLNPIEASQYLSQFNQFLPVDWFTSTSSHSSSITFGDFFLPPALSTRFYASSLSPRPLPYSFAPLSPPPTFNFQNFPSLTLHLRFHSISPSTHSSRSSSVCSSPRHNSPKSPFTQTLPSSPFSSPLSSPNSPLSVPSSRTLNLSPSPAKPVSKSNSLSSNSPSPHTNQHSLSSPLFPN